MQSGATTIPYDSSNTPSWVYNSNYRYWTMSPYEDSAFDVWFVYDVGGLGRGDVYGTSGGAVRPVITLLKSAL